MSGTKKICFIMGNQRSGTNLLRDILTGSDDLSLAGEVITPSSHPFCWYNFLERRGIGAKGPDAWQEACDLVDEWLDDMQSRMAGRWDNGSVKSESSWVGGDVKYSQLRAISPVYWELSEIPFLLHYIMSRYGFIIHTRRRNTFKLVLSAMIAEQSGIWHAHGPNAFKQKFELNIDECVLRVTRARMEEVEFLRLSAHVQTIECFYEDLVENMPTEERRSPETGLYGPLANIHKLLRLKGGFSPNTQFKKVVSQPYGQVVSNFDALLMAFSSTDFAAMAEEIRAEEP
jgi:LPS sulfotransferase NodH